MKRATYIYSVPFTMTVISIHALVKRATVMLTEIDYKIYISIHALVKGAAPTKLDLWFFPSFQSTPS